jgi:hypothetical protein
MEPALVARVTRLDCFDVLAAEFSSRGRHAGGGRGNLLSSRTPKRYSCFKLSLRAREKGISPDAIALAVKLGASNAASRRGERAIESYL